MSVCVCACIRECVCGVCDGLGVESILLINKARRRRNILAAASVLTILTGVWSRGGVWSCDSYLLVSHPFGHLFYSVRDSIKKEKRKYCKKKPGEFNYFSLFPYIKQNVRNPLLKGTPLRHFPFPSFVRKMYFRNSSSVVKRKYATDVHIIKFKDKSIIFVFFFFLQGKYMLMK